MVKVFWCVCPILIQDYNFYKVTASFQRIKALVDQEDF